MCQTSLLIKLLCPVIKEVERLYYICSESKGADQLVCGNRAADLRLCFCLCEKQGFLCSYVKLSKSPACFCKCVDQLESCLVKKFRHIFSQHYRFRTGRSGQAVKTQIRLLLEEQSDQGLHCLLLNCFFWRHFSAVAPTCSSFRVITAIVVS